MNISINGKTQSVSANLRLPELLQQLGLADKPVVIELNLNALTPSELQTTVLNEGDQLELVILAPGG